MKYTTLMMTVVLLTITNPVCSQETQRYSKTVVPHSRHPFQALEAQRAEEIEGLVRQAITDEGIPGLSIAIANKNKLVYARGFGQADVENSVSVSPETKFRTASIAKPITAVAVLALAEEGKVDLDAEVQAYCAEYPKKRWPLTSRQLLGHLGGVRHYKHSGESLSTQHYFSLDSALGTAVQSALPAGSTYSTTDLKVSFVRPLKPDSGRLRAEGEVIHIGRTMATSQARLVGIDSGKLFAHGTATCAIFQVRQP